MAASTTSHGSAPEGSQASQITGAESRPAVPRVPINPIPPIKPGPIVIRSSISIANPAQGSTVKGAEPGVLIAISGSYIGGTAALNASSLWVEIACDGQVTTVQLAAPGPPAQSQVASPRARGRAATSPTSGTFSGEVHCYHAGKQTITVTLKAIGGSEVSGSALRPALNSPLTLATASATATVSLTQSEPTVTISTPQPVAFSDVTTTQVPVTVTTADTSVFGGRSVTAAGPDGKAVTLTPVSGSTTRFAGAVPCGPSLTAMVTATCMCTAATDLRTTTQPVKVTGLDVTAPTVTIGTSPGSTIRVTAGPAEGEVDYTFAGTAYDDQTGVSKVVGSLRDAQGHTMGPVTAQLDATTGVGAGGQPVLGSRKWSVPLPVTSGSYTLTVTATDTAGNTSAPDTCAFTVVRATPTVLLPESLDEQTYLAALVTFAAEQIAPAAGGSGGVTVTDLEQALNQPVDFGDRPEVATLPINELRVPVELLRAHLASTGVDEPVGGFAGEEQYRQAAYDALLAAVGTTDDELRLARGAGTDTRAALADRIGIQLAPSSVPGCRDQLDELTFDGDQLTEPALETYFALPDSHRDAAEPVGVSQSRVLTWRIAHQQAGWAAEDRRPPAPRRFGAVVNPDVIGPDSVIATGPAGPQVLALLTQRSTDLDTERSRLTAARAGDTPAAQFAAVITAGLPGLDLDALAADEAGGQPIDSQLAGAGLDRTGYVYLQGVRSLATAGTVRDSEWAAITDVLVGAYRRRQYPAWAAAENTAGIILSPDVFVTGGESPDTSTYRVDPSAYDAWQGVLADRVAQRRALLDGAAGMVAAVEQSCLPLLRSALLTAAEAHPGPGAGPDTAAAALSDRFLVDFDAGGTLRTTRMQQVITSLQTLLALVRSGDNAGRAAAPFAGWTLRTDLTGQRQPVAFDTGWRWIADYDSWASAMSALWFPESALDPGMLAPGVPSGTSSARPPYAALTEALSPTVALTPEAVDTAVNAYLAVARNGQLPTGATGGPTGAGYLSDRSSANQMALAGACDPLMISNPELAREVFWAVPMLVAQRLRTTGQYQRALDWLWVVFPYDDAGTNSAYSKINDELSKPGTPVLALPAGWAADMNPFSLIEGRGAPSYLRATLLAIIGCLVDYADAEFTAETEQSVAHARDLYRTAQSLVEHPMLQPAPAGVGGEAEIPIPQVTAARTQISCQLSKLHQGRNIAGMPRTVGEATGQAIAAPTDYHFKVLLGRAQQLTQQADQLEAQYLSAMEKLDVKQLQLSDARQALGLATAQLTEHAAQVQSAADGVAVARAQQTAATVRAQTLQSAIANPSNQYEQQLLGQYGQMRDIQDVLAGTDAAIGIAQAAATAASGALLSFGATAVAAGVEATAYEIRAGETMRLNNVQAQMQANQLKAGIAERQRQWKMQLAGARQDVAVATAQVRASAAQVAIATAQQQVAQLQNSQAAATLRLLENQFTNADLYQWLSQTLGSVYRYFLQQATATARLAQAQLAFERAETAKDFIQSSYWNPTPATATGTDDTTSDHRGLTGAEQLTADLQRLSSYAFSTDTRALNISQTFSLARLMPMEFFDFQSSGLLEFNTPMEWFDTDFPGHYQRLIRQARLSVVALVPPSRGIRATLGTNGISRVVIPATNGFTAAVLRRDPCHVALTSPLNASGVFAIDLQPDMLLPFEGNGVDATWQLSLPPAANPFDFSTIADVLLTVDYTALTDPGYRAQILSRLNQDRGRGSDCVFSLARDFPDQWYALNNPVPGQPRATTLTLRPADFPPHLQGLRATDLAVAVQSDGALPAVQITLVHDAQTGTATTGPDGLASTRRGAPCTNLLGDSPLGDWAVSFAADADTLFDQQQISDVLMMVSWSASADARQF